MLTSLIFFLLAAQDDRIYKVGEEGVQAPKIVHRVEPKYSDAAREAKIDGAVVLSAVISTGGKAEKIVVLRKLEPSLDQNAIKAVEEWRFEPATRDGVPVRVKATIEVNFRRL